MTAGCGGLEPRSPNLRARDSPATSCYHLWLHWCFSKALHPTSKASVGLGVGRVTTALSTSRLCCVADQPWPLSFPECPQPAHLPREKEASQGRNSGPDEPHSCLGWFWPVRLSFFCVKSGLQPLCCQPHRAVVKLGWKHFIFIILFLD